MPTRERERPSAARGTGAARDPRARRGRLLAALLIVALVPLVFARLFTADFLHWDDYANILYNPRIVPPTLAGALWFWGHPYLDLYVPLTFSTWSWLASLGGASDATGAWQVSPFVFHAANVALHAGSALVVFHLLVKLVGRTWPACAGALLFALHPVQVETVGWVSGLKDLAFSFWSLCACAGILATLERAEEREGARFPLAPWLFASLAFALALLSKPTAMVVPVFAWLLVRWRFPDGHRFTARALLPWLVVALGWAALTKHFQPAIDVPEIALWQRPLVAGHALAFYLWKLVWPFDLAIDYGMTPEHVLAHRWGELAILLPAALAVALLLARRRVPQVAAAAALFLLPVAPVLGLVPFDFQAYSTVADHYLYLALFGPSLLAATLLARLPDPARKAGLAGTVLVLGLLAARSFDQTKVWKTGEAFFEHTLRVNPRSASGHLNLGVTHLDQGRLGPAEAELRRAVELDPGSGKGNFNLGVVLVRSGRREEAVPFLERGARGQPTDAGSRGYLGTLCYQMGRFEEALRWFEEAIRLDPRSHVARHSLGMTLARLGQHARAASEFEEALRLRPDFAPAAQELARARAAVRAAAGGG